jgi:hypothetical protein
VAPVLEPPPPPPLIPRSSSFPPPFEQPRSPPRALRHFPRWRSRPCVPPSGRAAAWVVVQRCPGRRRLSSSIWRCWVPTSAPPSLRRALRRHGRLRPKLLYPQLHRGRADLTDLADKHLSPPHRGAPSPPSHIAPPDPPRRRPAARWALPPPLLARQIRRSTSVVCAKTSSCDEHRRATGGPLGAVGGWSIGPRPQAR